jgi:hypothetical protein
MVASYADSMLINSFMPNTEMEGSRLADLSIQSSAYGIDIEKPLGQFRLAGNIIWGTNFVEHKKTETHRSGKGGGGKTKTTTYWYTVSAAIGICEGPISGILRVWADGKEVTKQFAGTSPTIKHTLYLGNEDQEPDPFVQALEKNKPIPAYRGLAYIVLKDLDLSDFGNRIPNFTFEVVNSGHSVATAIREVTSRTWLNDSTDISVSGLYELPISGMMLKTSNTHRANIETLMNSHNFCATEVDGKLVFKQKSRFMADYQYPVDVVELGAKEGDEGEENAYSVERKHDLELPSGIIVKYVAVDKDYQQGSQSAYRASTHSKEVSVLGIDLVMTDSQAKELAEQKLYEAWTRRNSVKFTMGPRWAFLCPGYILKTTIANRLRYIQINKATLGAGYVMSIEGTDIGGNTFTAGDRVTDGEVNAPVEIEPTEVMFEFLDMSRPTEDSSSDPVLYFAATGLQYNGAAIFETKDGGASWILKTSTTARSTMGTASLLGIGSANSWDKENVLTVTLISGTLESRPEIDVLNGYNAAMVGNEIIQFRYATLIATNTYQLSHLLRGRLGTEDQIDKHIVDDRFVLLDTSSIISFSAPSTEWFAPKPYKIVPITKDLSDDLTVDVTFTNSARLFQPWSVSHVSGTRNGSNDLIVSWIRRDRSNTAWIDGVDMPMTETSERYEIDIIGSSGTILRTIESSAPTTTYTASSQVADFGSVQSSIKIRIYQMSSIRGRGIEKEVIL